jgi:putative effector of murein hydrolase
VVQVAVVAQQAATVSVVIRPVAPTGRGVLQTLAIALEAGAEADRVETLAAVAVVATAVVVAVAASTAVEAVVVEHAWYRPVGLRR